MLAAAPPSSAAAVVATGFCAAAKTTTHHPSGHPSPTESECGGSSGSKTSRSDLPDTHSESSDISPTSPHSSESNPDLQRKDDTPQDLSLPKQHNTAETSFESDHLDLKCKECGCLFGDETLLAMHVQETHQAVSVSNGLSSYHQHYLQAAFQSNGYAGVPNSTNGYGNGFPTTSTGTFLDTPTERGGQNAENDAIASLLSLQQAQKDAMQGGLAEEQGGSEKSKIFNPEAYCDICNKEFCNKYYLQTHKATKHGISATSSLSLVPPPRTSSFSNLIQEQIQQANDLQSPGGPTTPIATSAAAHAPLATYSTMAGLLGGGLAANGFPMNGANQPQQSPQLPTVPSLSEANSSLGPDCRCPYCGQGLPSQYHLQSHIITNHSSAVANSSASAAMQQMLNPQAALQAMYAAQLMGSLGSATGSPSPLGNVTPNSFTSAAANPFSPFLDRIKLMAAAGFMQQQQPPMSSASYQINPATLAAFGLAAPSVQDFPSPFQPSVSQATSAFTGAAPDLQQYLNAAAAAAISSSDDAMEPGQQRGSGLHSMELTSGGSNGSSLDGQQQGGGHQVMNRDAYCEICRKEFCNKYFLKTHKQKKHGIPIEESPSSGRKRSISTSLPNNVSSVITNLFQDCQLRQEAHLQVDEPPMKRSPLSEALSKPPSVITSTSIAETNGQNYNNERAGSPDGLQIADTNGSVKEEPKESTEANSEESLQNFLRLQQQQLTSSLADYPNLQTTPAATQAAVAAGTFQCSVCRKSFGSTFMLLAHTYQEHPGQGLVGLESAFPSVSPTTPKKEGVITNGKPRTTVDPEAYCEICQKEFCSKYFLKTHKQNIHGIFTEGGPGTTTATPPSGLNLAAIMQNFNNPSSPKRGSFGGMSVQSANNSPGIRGLSPSVSVMGGTTPTSGSRPRYVSGKNFCEICNKEVCNKYFLRTHMLKMHGIVIDENKTIIGNINTVDKEKTGVLKFRCNICNQELPSRQGLKVHKLKIHGIATGSTDSFNNSDLSDILNLSGAATNSGALDAITSTNGAPPNVTVNGNATPNMTNGTPMQAQNGDQNGLSPSDMVDERGRSYFDNFNEVCPHCDRRFMSTKWLKSHMYTDHGIGSPPKMEDGKTTETGSATDTNLLNCEYCTASFDDIIALQLHLIGQHAYEIHGRAKSMAENAAVDTFSNNAQTGRPMPYNGPTTSEELKLSGTEEESTTEAAEKKPEAKGDEVKQSPPMVVRHVNGTKLYRCSYCHYYTKWLSNLSVHEKRHTGSTPREEKPFICSICLRAYRYAHSLERHKSVHRYSWLNGNSHLAMKFGTSPQKSPKKGAAGLKTPQKFPNMSEDVDEEEMEGEAKEGEGFGLSQAIATGAKRFRCTKCQKVFKSRELCRSHLFAVHRRQEFYPSPHKASADAFLLDKDDKSAATIAQVVEELHSQREQQSAATKQEFDDNDIRDTGDLDSITDEKINHQSQQKVIGYGVPVQSPEDTGTGAAEIGGKPYVMQSFEAEGAEKDGSTDLKSFFNKMVIYLPVFSRLNEPVDLTLKLTPLKPQNGDIQSL